MAWEANILHQFYQKKAVRWESYIKMQLLVNPASPAFHEAEPKAAALYDAVTSTGLSNYLGARQPLPTKFNLPLWEKLLPGYFDTNLLKFITFCFLLGYAAHRLPQSADSNLGSALQNATYIDAYLHPIGAASQGYTRPIPRCSVYKLGHL